MKLDIQFIVYGLIIIAGLVPLYIYREKIFNKFYKTGDIKRFIKDLEIYLNVHYPKISFDYILMPNVESEKDIRIKETLIVEDLIKQFANFEYELKTQANVTKDKLWKGYDSNSKLLKDNKLPIDWSQRKEAAWIRDNNKCNRCGFRTKLMDTNILLAKQMRNGGGFNLENIVVLCSDCSRIIKSANVEKTSRDLHILDNLMRKVTN